MLHDAFHTAKHAPEPIAGAPAADDRLISRKIALREYFGGISVSTAWRRECSDPTWPKPISMARYANSRVYYRLCDILAKLKNLPNEQPVRRRTPRDHNRATIS